INLKALAALAKKIL
uniref:Mastoparan-L n=2 Tax=Vespula TaxID=7451 RepID=MAST_VESLE|nr:RecName: Full=Mastoparan-L; Short=MP-L; Short=Mast-L [Vespula lewisii]